MKEFIIKYKYEIILSGMIFILGFVLSFFRWASQDEVTYLKETMIMSEMLRHGQWFGNESVGSHGFIFKLPVALIYLISGPQIWIPTIFNIILASFSTVLIFKLSFHFLKNNFLSVITVILVVFSYYYIGVLTKYLRDIPVMFMMLVFILALVKNKSFWILGVYFMLVLDAKEYIAIILTPPLIIWVVVINWQKYKFSFKNIGSILLNYFQLFIPSVLLLYLMFFTSIVPVNSFVASIFRLTAIESTITNFNINQQKLNFGTDTNKVVKGFGIEYNETIGSISESDVQHVKDIAKRSLDFRATQPKREINEKYIKESKVLEKQIASKNPQTRSRKRNTQLNNLISQISNPKSSKNAQLISKNELKNEKKPSKLTLLAEIKAQKEKNYENQETRIRSVKDLPDAEQIKIKNEIAEFLNIPKDNKDFVDVSLDSLEFLLLSSSPEVRQEYLKLLNSGLDFKPKIASLNTRQNDENFSKSSLRQFAETVLLGEAPKSVKESTAQNVISKQTNTNSIELKNRESGIEESKALARNIKENTTSSLNASKRDVLTNEQRIPNSDLSRKTNSENLINTKTPSELKSKGISELLAERERELATSKREGTRIDSKIQTDISDTRAGISSSLKAKDDSEIEGLKSPKLATVTLSGVEGRSKELSPSGLGVRSSEVTTSGSVSRTARNEAQNVGRESGIAGAKSSPQSIKDNEVSLTQSGRNSRAGEESVSGTIAGSGKSITGTTTSRESSVTGSSKGISELLAERERELATSKREGTLSDTRIQTDISDNRAGISSSLKAKDDSEIEGLKSPKLATVILSGVEGRSKELSPSGLGVRSSEVSSTGSVSRTARNEAQNVGRESGIGGAKSSPQSIKDTEVSLTQSGRDSRAGEESVSGTIAGSGKTISGTTTSRESSLTGSSKGISELLAERERELATSKREGTISDAKTQSDISDTRRGISSSLKAKEDSQVEGLKSPKFATVTQSGVGGRSKELVIGQRNNNTSSIRMDSSKSKNQSFPEKFNDNNIKKTNNDNLKNKINSSVISKSNNQSKTDIYNISKNQISQNLAEELIVKEKLNSILISVKNNNMQNDIKIIKSKSIKINEYALNQNLEPKLNSRIKKPIIIDERLLKDTLQFSKVLKIVNDPEVTKTYNEIIKKSNKSNVTTNIQKKFKEKLDVINLTRYQNKKNKNIDSSNNISVVKYIENSNSIEILDIAVQRIDYSFEENDIHSDDKSKKLLSKAKSASDDEEKEVSTKDFKQLEISKESMIAKRGKLWGQLEFYGMYALNILLIYTQKILSPRTFSYMSFPLYIVIISFIVFLRNFKKWLKESDKLFLGLFFIVYLAIFILRPSHARYLLHLGPIISLFFIYFLNNGYHNYKKLLIPILITLPFTIASLYFEITYPAVKAAAHIFFYSLLGLIIYFSFSQKEKFFRFTVITLVVSLSFFSGSSAIFQSYTKGQIHKSLIFGHNNEYKEIAKYFDKNKTYWFNSFREHLLIQFYNRDINQGLATWQLGKGEGYILKSWLPKSKMESKFKYIPNFYHHAGYFKPQSHADLNTDYIALLYSERPDVAVFPDIHNDKMNQEVYFEFIQHPPSWLEIVHKVQLKNKKLFIFKIRYE